MCSGRWWLMEAILSVTIPPKKGRGIGRNVLAVQEHHWALRWRGHGSRADLLTSVGGIRKSTHS